MALVSYIIVSHKKRVGPFPDGLVQLIYSLIQDGRIEGDDRPAAEETWLQDWGIDIPCKYNVYGKFGSKYSVRNILNKH